MQWNLYRHENNVIENFQNKDGQNVCYNLNKKIYKIIKYSDLNIIKCIKKIFMGKGNALKFSQWLWES